MSKKILIAEDESILRLDLSMMLKDAGYDVIGDVDNGEKAIEFVHDQKPDLIIMDIKMPRLNGLKASKIINDKFNIPILILSAYSQTDYINKAKEANIIGYVVKPISEDRLLPAVEIALHQGEVANRYEKKIDETSQKLQNRKLIEKAKGVLMDRFNYSETIAFQKMQKLSMNKQVRIEKVARYILKKYSAESVSN